MTDDGALVEALLAGEHRALARVITKIENREPGYRSLVSELYTHAGGAAVVGVTGSPGAGKSTLVDRLAEAYRERDETVGVIAIDPSSPFTGGAVLGDRIRMASTVGDMDVFVRSMSARGSLGGLSTATTDAVVAMAAFGMDTIIIETVGAGQNEVDVVRTADTVAVLVQPGAGDTVQTLKAGIFEIADVFVVNKADRPGADRTVRELLEMVDLAPNEADEWTPPVVETVATTGDGLESFLAELDAHAEYLENTGDDVETGRRRHEAEITTLLREDLRRMLEAELDRRGGVLDFAEAVRTGKTDPYTVADDVLSPFESCLDNLAVNSSEGDATSDEGESSEASDSGGSGAGGDSAESTE